jgi:endonuclease-3 related protein
MYRPYQDLDELYRTLLKNYGPQHWWPADGPFEVMVGAVLTQATAWQNAASAMSSLKSSGCLSPSKIRELPPEQLAGLIRSSGYYNTKARKLKALADWLDANCRDDIRQLAARQMQELRQSLLAIYGIGPETADSILLYALDRPVFVVDGYSRRIVNRLGMSVPRDVKYSQLQTFFMENLPADSGVYGEFHALLVQAGKHSCRKKPRCYGCCLNKGCQYFNHQPAG